MLGAMVLSEEDVAASKRKGEEFTTPEGNRKKKQKKQKQKEGATPRPACSWVHFSREFIKEYSASHPQSSGLKAATRAASDAWKTMSVDEKAKYTKRAREVWDDYLSTAPAREPRPRTQTKLVTRCSPGRLLNLLQGLTPDQKDAVKSMGFGSLLGLRCRTLRRSLCLWLLEKFNTVRRSLEISGDRIPLTPRDVELVMGLAASGKDVVSSGPDDQITELRQHYNATNRGISLRVLEQHLAAPESGEDFKRSFVLYVLGTLLCPTARLDVSASFLHFLTNMDDVHQYNWGKFLLDRLVREISRFRQGKQRAVGGCLLFLQFFYYESVAVGGPSELAPIVAPCLSSWGEEEISEREKRERDLGGYGLGEVVWKERLPATEALGDRLQSNGLLMGTVYEDRLSRGQVNVAREDEITGETVMEAVPINAVCGDMKVVQSVRASSQNTEYVRTKTVNSMKKKAHKETHAHTACVCPLEDCDFVGSSEQLSLHFSSTHWDSGRRFRYNCPLSISLDVTEAVFILQAEEDGLLFLLNKGVETIGHTIMVSCVQLSSSKDRFLYDIVAERGISSIRLKSSTRNFPGRVEGFPPTDFLLIPFNYFDSSGQLDLEVCIWNMTQLGAD